MAGSSKSKLEKIGIVPIPEGFVYIGGERVEDVLGILEENNVSDFLCRPNSPQGSVRDHTIIITQRDYRCMNEVGFEIDTDGSGLSRVGFHFRAQYNHESPEKLEETYSQVRGSFYERTIVRPVVPAFSSYDGDFLEVNGLSLAQAMRRE